MIIADRLVLRPINWGDKVRIVEHFGDLRIARWFRSIRHPYTTDDCDEFLKRAEHGWQNGKDLIFAILPGGSKQLSGIVILKIKENGLAHIGYSLDPKLWGQGYASEAVEAVQQWALSSLGVKRFRARVVMGNQASVRLLERNGFVETGKREKVFVTALSQAMESAWFEKRKKDKQP